MKVRRLAAEVVYQGLTVAAQSPALAVSLARLGRYGYRLARDTDVVIEGFPRSGNSFAVAAFRRAQDRPVHIAHHLHAPGHVIAAVRKGIPTLVVIRDPGQAVPEFAASKPNLSVRAILRGYVRFYEPLLPHRSGFVAGQFDEVLADFGSVVRKLNQRFATTFTEFEPAEPNLAAVHAEVDEEYRQRKGAAPAILGSVETSAGEQVERSRVDYARPDVASLRSRARTLYDEFVREP